MCYLSTVDSLCVTGNTNIQRKDTDILNRFIKLIEQVVYNGNNLYCYTLNNVNMGTKKNDSNELVKVRKVNDNESY